MLMMGCCKAKAEQRPFLHTENGQLITTGVNHVGRAKAQPAPSESGLVLKKIDNFRYFY